MFVFLLYRFLFFSTTRVVLRVIILSIMNQFKEIPLLKSLLNFQKDACNIFHILSKCYHFMANNVRGYLEFCRGQSQWEARA